MSEYYITKNELYHHGIKGQKWGLRRFQNEDGSYTNIGKERRRVGNEGDPTKSLTKLVNKKADSVEKEKKKRDRANQLERQETSALKPGKDGKPSKAEKIANKTRDLSTDVSNLDSAIQRRKNRDRIREREKEIESMTDQDLRKKIDRHRLENEYRKVIEEEETLKSGETKVNEILDIAVPIMGIASSAVAIFATIYQIKHGL